MKDKSVDSREKFAFLFEEYGNLLPQSQKQVFQLYYFEDLTLSEIAKIIASSRQAANDALKKAQHRLLYIAKKCPKN